jgi:hypothetical protein
MMWPLRRRADEQEEARVAAQQRKDDELALLTMLVGRAQARLDGQLLDSDALDTKALGVLAVDAAAIALMVAVRADLAQLWWVPTATLGVAGVLLLATIWPRKFDVGPDTRTFYEEMTGNTRIDAASQMLSELLAAIDRNDKQIPAKNQLFKIAFTVLLVGLLGCLVVALVS